MFSDADSASGMSLRIARMTKKRDKMQQGFLCKPICGRFLKYYNMAILFALLKKILREKISAWRVVFVFAWDIRKGYEGLRFYYLFLKSVFLFFWKKRVLVFVVVFGIHFLFRWPTLLSIFGCAELRKKRYLYLYKYTCILSPPFCIWQCLIPSLRNKKKLSKFATAQCIKHLAFIQDPGKSRIPRV